MTTIQFLNKCVGKDINSIRTLAKVCLKPKTAQRIINAVLNAANVCDEKAKEFYIHRYSLVKFYNNFSIEGSSDEGNYATYANIEF